MLRGEIILLQNFSLEKNVNEPFRYNNKVKSDCKPKFIITNEMACAQTCYQEPQLKTCMLNLNHLPTGKPLHYVNITSNSWLRVLNGFWGNYSI